MKITERTIDLDSNDLARAVDLYVKAMNVAQVGPRTVFIVAQGERYLARECSAQVYVDPSGKVVDNGAPR